MPIERLERYFLWAATAMLAIFFGTVTVSAFTWGLQLPGPSEQVDPETLDKTVPFDKPGLREIAPGEYEAVIIAQAWAFLPAKLEVPAGATVTFKITARDIIHGFEIPGKRANVMVIPGQVSSVTVKFDRPGEYLFICHEYCGVAHHIMYGTITVA
jgi:cytochrome c oxidase subunit 2